MSERKAAFCGLDRKELAVFLAYILMVCCAAWFYQGSEDEGRVWMLSRSFSIYQLVFHVLRYEGHPALFYVLLWLPAHLHMPFPWLTWLCAAVASVAVYWMLRFSPFPFYVRALLPFGFGLGFQYAVVARSYVLFPLLGFLVVTLYRERRARPVLMAAVLGLLANVSIHGTLVAGGFAVAYAFRLWKERRRAERIPPRRREVLLGAGIFASSVLLVAITVWPAKYLNLSYRTMGQKILHRMMGPVSENSHQWMVAPGPVRSMNEPVLQLASFTQTAASPAPSLPAARVASRFSVERLRTVLGYPVSDYFPLSVLFELLVIVFLYRQRKLILILPAVLLMYFLLFVYAQPWHTGLLWITLLLILWAAWDEAADAAPLNLQRVLAAMLAIVCVLQMRWTADELRWDAGHATFPAKAAAAYLKTLPPGERIDARGTAFTVLPYFQNYIFIDEGTDRFSQHGFYPASPTVAGFLAEHPDVLLLQDETVTADEISALRSGGYVEKHSFCGEPYLPHQSYGPTCILGFERK